MSINCVLTKAGEPDEDGRSSPVIVEGSEHSILCGMVIAAVGQKGMCEELERYDLMDSDRVRADFSSMRTSDPKVFAAGDGAFGGSTIVMAMHHGQRAAYYVKSYLDDIHEPLPYRTPFRTRRVPVAQDLLWETLPLEEPVFHGLGKDPVTFPEIEDTYDEDAAMREAARCYRCDAETGSADYSVRHREDIFSMARTNPLDKSKHQAMLQRRLEPRENPFPENRWPSLDDIVFLPANLSRLVIDPYREACQIDVMLGNQLKLEPPFVLAGFDSSPEEIQRAIGSTLQHTGVAYLGAQSLGEFVPWIQWCRNDDVPSAQAVGYVQSWGGSSKGFPEFSGLIGLSVKRAEQIESAIDYGLENNVGLLILDGASYLDGLTDELTSRPHFELLPLAVEALRSRRQEETIDLIYAGGVRSGTDAAKFIGMGASAVVYGVAAAVAMGGVISEDSVQFDSDRTIDERKSALEALLKANSGEASMMARCTGKTRLHNLEPEDLRSVTLVTSDVTKIPLVGHQSGNSKHSDLTV